MNETETQPTVGTEPTVGTAPMVDAEPIADSAPDAAPEPAAGTGPDTADDDAAQAEIGEICGRWLAEAEALQRQLPEFSLAGALADERFCTLLRAGADVRTAYGAVHLNELCAAAAREAERRVENRLRQNGRRPAENGTVSVSGRAYGGDAARLTDRELADICRRVAGGERISFG